MKSLVINQNILIKYKKIPPANYFGNISVFLFFSLILPTNSGHSIAIIFALVASILSIPQWKIEKTPKELIFTCFFIAFLGLFWSHTFDDLFTFSLKGDYLLRYGLGIFMLLSFWRIRINPRSIIYGIAVGSIAAGVLAFFQYKTIGRAQGFTNAIRFGDLAILMAMICTGAALVNFFSKKERIFFLIASFFAFIASALSLSRGGWPVLISLPIILFVFLNVTKKTASIVAIGFIAFIFIFINLPPVAARINAATQEINGYFFEKDKYINTSLGVRLEQWKTAYLMGMEKPITGWGSGNIKQGKIEYIERGISDPSIMNYTHAHNDFLETWARRGIVGVISLIAIYLIPIIIFKKFSSRITIHSKELQQLNKLLIVSGVLIYFGYFIFGLSDVFFTFVIGHNFYLFSLIFLLSTFAWIEKQSDLKNDKNKST